MATRHTASGAPESDKMVVYHFFTDDRHRGSPKSDVLHTIAAWGQTFGQAETHVRTPVYALTVRAGLDTSRTHVSLNTLNEDFEVLRDSNVGRLERYDVRWTYNEGDLGVEMCYDTEGREENTLKLTWIRSIKFQEALKVCGAPGLLSETHSVSLE
jgi:hypothetical protein